MLSVLEAAYQALLDRAFHEGFVRAISTDASTKNHFAKSPSSPPGQNQRKSSVIREVVVDR